MYLRYLLRGSNVDQAPLDRLIDHGAFVLPRRLLLRFNLAGSNAALQIRRGLRGAVSHFPGAPLSVFPPNRIEDAALQTDRLAAAQDQAEIRLALLLPDDRDALPLAADFAILF